MDGYGNGNNRDDERNNRDDNRPFRDPPICLHIAGVFAMLKLLLSQLFFCIHYPWPEPLTTQRRFPGAFLAVLFRRLRRGSRSGALKRGDIAQNGAMPSLKM